MVRDANGRIQAIVGDIPGLLCVKCVGRCFSGNLYELQFLNRRKTAWFAIQVLYWTIYEDIFQWSFLCFQFQSSDNSSQVFRNLQTGERTLDGEFFSEFLGSHSRFLSKFFMVFINIFSFFSTFSFKFSHIYLQRNTGRWGFQLCGQSSRCSSSFANQHIFPNSRFVTWFNSFQNCFTHVFLFLFFSHHSQKVQQPYAWRIIVACMHRWHAKPFYLL